MRVWTVRRRPLGADVACSERTKIWPLMESASSETSLEDSEFSFVLSRSWMEVSDSFFSLFSFSSVSSSIISSIVFSSGSFFTPMPPVFSTGFFSSLSVFSSSGFTSSS